MDSRLRGNDGYRKWRNFLPPSLLFVILANAVTHFKARGCFESIKPTKSVRSALAEAWIPACAGMTGIESGEISYRPCFYLSSSRMRGPILKRANVFELIKPTKSVCSAPAEAWIPACAGMTDTESNEISYRPWLLFVVLVNAGIYLKRKDVFESIKPTKNVRSALAEAWIPACAGMTGIESGEISYRPCFYLSSSRMRGPILKRANVFELIKPTKSVCSAPAEAWIPACAGMTDTESNEISYRPWLLFVVLVNAGTHFQARGCFESIKPTKSVCSAFAEE
ncbi:hypothetical protein [Vibrio vulnificus]|uniref:hypothetical protein n=1 Tax=Vibrio vulnificus TaxID=672 RepID=UPI0010239156|nr:hypothetical protein [Vibrio vulnificus]RZP58956.1 hypothetical protein D8T45_19800 [Vibrio vulnificus]